MSKVEVEPAVAPHGGGGGAAMAAAAAAATEKLRTIHVKMTTGRPYACEDTRVGSPSARPPVGCEN